MHIYPQDCSLIMEIKPKQIYSPTAQVDSTFVSSVVTVSPPEGAARHLFCFRVENDSKEVIFIYLFILIFL